MSEQTKLDTGGPAFPRAMQGEHGFLNDPGAEGMTWLDYAAIHAPEPYLPEPIRGLSDFGQIEYKCRARYLWALEMLREKRRLESEYQVEASHD